MAHTSSSGGHTSPGVSSRGRRWLGRVLVVQGIAGLALLLPTLVIAASILVGQVGRAGIAGSLDHALERAQLSVADGARATRAADTALLSTSTSTEDTSAMLSELAATMRDGSASLRISLFGQQPFVALADSFARTAERADLAARSIGATGPQVELTRRSMADLSADLDSLAIELAAVRAAAPSEAPAIVLVILVVSVAGWLAIAAAICLGVGWRLLRPFPELPASGRRPRVHAGRPSEGPSDGRRNRGSDQQATGGTTG
jgi:hypothetical protein